MSRRSFFYLLLFCVCFSGCARAPRISDSMVSRMAPPSAYVVHTVRPGETLYRIAKTYNLDVSDILRVNRIESPRRLSAGQALTIPQTSTPAPVVPTGVEPISIREMERVVGPKSRLYSWSTITVHHSGTLQGGARLFDKDHRRRKMGGLFYHFVIGNGTSTPDGAVEVGWRWQRQVKANRPNDIQICLVGNFDKQDVSERQFNSLTALVAVLKNQYGIPISKIRKHCDIPGKHTDCPGKRFPYSRLISRLS